MAKDHPKMVGDISKCLAKIGQEKPQVMQAFMNLGKAANEGGVIDEKTKELIALAIGVSQRCDGCIAFHVKKLIDLGTTREELADMLGVVIYMGGGPSLMYASECLCAYDEFKQK